MTTTQIILLAAGAMLAGIVAALLLLRPRFVLLNRKLMTDHATGLLNYEGFLQYLKKHQKKDSYVLYLLDLDDFRRFNRQGYDTGDRVLKAFALKLSRVVGTLAICARYRLGDEFLIMVRQKDSEKLAGVLDKLNHDTTYNDDPVHFSYGVAAIECNDADCFSAIRIAHEILMSKKPDQSAQ